MTSNPRRRPIRQKVTPPLSQEEIFKLQLSGLSDEEHPELLDWAAAYCVAAEAAGEPFDLDDFPEAENPVQNTIRVVSELYELNEDSLWLSWQTYDLLRGRRRRRVKSNRRGKGKPIEPLYLLQAFKEPVRWEGAQFVIGNPWDFIFAYLYLANDMNDITFEIAKLNGKRFTGSEHQDLALAIVDGMDYDCTPEDYRAILTKKPGSLKVRLWNPINESDWEGKNTLPDEDGIVWWPR